MALISLCIHVPSPRPCCSYPEKRCLLLRSYMEKELCFACERFLQVMTLLRLGGGGRPRNALVPWNRRCAEEGSAAGQT